MPPNINNYSINQNNPQHNSSITINNIKLPNVSAKKSIVSSSQDLQKLVEYQPYEHSDASLVAINKILKKNQLSMNKNIISNLYENNANLQGNIFNKIKSKNKYNLPGGKNKPDYNKSLVMNEEDE
eukprot:CAMPEP_0170541442 /NCGR_PEP_ID=MMETSP0211-20121228/1165_1 /TAXON_ID=311385 /ORGANISM="Pseudokeronopsis sp., Strain OXSARD2" /LENGTH=125 /DNA_ID=CAMNT_0010844157 /DNA_START=2110 /DNA_END=2487 /DNA_ORIENTATION=+